MKALLLVLLLTACATAKPQEPFPRAGWNSRLADPIGLQHTSDRP